MPRVWEVFDDDDDEPVHIKAEEDALLHHPAIEVSLTTPLRRLRQIAVDACPPPTALLAAQRALLRSAAARLACKGLSSDTETYRRLGLLVPPYRYPADFARALAALRDYWQHHGRARSLGHAAPYRRVQQRAARYLRIRAGLDDGLGDGPVPPPPNPESLLPSPTDMRVFRLVNGNLEIPPTLFKALSCAGRLEDSFFPDEPATWGNNDDDDRGGRHGGRVPRAKPDVAVKDEDDDDDAGGGGGGGSDGSAYDNAIDLTWDDDEYDLPSWPRRGGTSSTVDLTVGSHDDWADSRRNRRHSSNSAALRAARRAAPSAAPVFVFSPTVQVMPSLFGGAEDGRGSSSSGSGSGGANSAASMLTGMFDSFRSFVTAAAPTNRTATAAPASRSSLLLESSQTRNKRNKRDRKDDRDGWRVAKRGRLY